MSQVVEAIKNMIRPIVPVRVKQHYEMKYWSEKKSDEGELSNKHYEQFYTSHFGINPSFYIDKVLLDIGCGPRGSLEWASMSSRRIGLDPLASKYLTLGADQHKMEYIDSPSEKIPLADASCDAIFSFNSLDHVDNLQRTSEEIKRVAKPGGIFLLLVEVNHPPTVCEPHGLTPKIILGLFESGFELQDVQLYQSVVEHDMYASLLERKVIDNPVDSKEIGFLSLKYTRRTG